MKKQTHKLNERTALRGIRTFKFPCDYNVQIEKIAPPGFERKKKKNF